ncbi:hypothetical protein C1I97_31785 [Streptomyces sp. NTH33]|nr:hypothetical protein C1I97_31785 [Streptomyces sp. NTH33]
MHRAAQRLAVHRDRDAGRAALRWFAQVGGAQGSGVNREPGADRHVEHIAVGTLQWAADGRLARCGQGPVRTAQGTAAPGQHLVGSISGPLGDLTAARVR